MPNETQLLEGPQTIEATRPYTIKEVPFEFIRENPGFKEINIHSITVDQVMVPFMDDLVHAIAGIDTEGKIQGYALVNKHPYKPNTLVLSAVMTSGEARGKKLAKEMVIDALDSSLKDSQIANIEATTQVDAPGDMLLRSQTLNSELEQRFGDRFQITETQNLSSFQPPHHKWLFARK